MWITLGSQNTAIDMISHGICESVFEFDIREDDFANSVMLREETWNFKLKRFELRANEQETIRMLRRAHRRFNLVSLSAKLRFTDSAHFTGSKIQSRVVPQEGAWAGPEAS